MAPPPIDTSELRLSFDSSDYSDKQPAQQTSLSEASTRDNQPEPGPGRLLHGLHRRIVIITDRMRRLTMSQACKDAIRPEVRGRFYQNVVAIFPDICPKYLEKLANEHNHESNSAINALVDAAEGGKPYPTRPKHNTLKRKRDDDESAQAKMSKLKQKYDTPERRARMHSPAELKKIKDVLRADFPLYSEGFIQVIMDQNGHLLFQTYIALYNLTSLSDREELSENGVIVGGSGSTAAGAAGGHRFAGILQMLQNSSNEADNEICEELKAARSFCSVILQEERAKTAEKKNYEDAKANGLVKDCECCFSEFAINRLVNCSAETPHFFCTDCARRQAETLVGLSKHDLCCMSTDGCSAGFSHEERGKFIDAKLGAALDRIEQEDMLRITDLENLAKCPFCPFAAECAPVEEDKEFRCQNPECQVVSCRLCEAETHIPKSCKEAAKESAGSARRQIEEAMSEALIRKCNKCQTSFIKEAGCNKMICPRMGCSNIQCYVCSKSCTYAHFNDTSRGGKAGNCPLFDDVRQRHNHEVRQAEEQARQRVAEENPQLDPELLKVEVPPILERGRGPQGLPNRELRAALYDFEQRILQIRDNHWGAQVAQGEGNPNLPPELYEPMMGPHGAEFQQAALRAFAARFHHGPAAAVAAGAAAQAAAVPPPLPPPRHVPGVVPPPMVNRPNPEGREQGIVVNQGGLEAFAPLQPRTALAVALAHEREREQERAQERAQERTQERTQERAQALAQAGAHINEILAIDLAWRAEEPDDDPVAEQALQAGFVDPAMLQRRRNVGLEREQGRRRRSARLAGRAPGDEEQNQQAPAPGQQQQQQQQQQQHHHHRRRRYHHHQ